jgi:hypothetical protein
MPYQTQIHFEDLTLLPLPLFPGWGVTFVLSLCVHEVTTSQGLNFIFCPEFMHIHYPTLVWVGTYIGIRFEATIVRLRSSITKAGGSLCQIRRSSGTKCERHGFALARGYCMHLSDCITVSHHSKELQDLVCMKVP